MKLNTNEGELTMFNNNGGYSLSDIAAATGNDGNGGFGFGNGDGAWILLLSRTDYLHMDYHFYHTHTF